MTTEMIDALLLFDLHATPCARIIANAYACLDSISPSQIRHVALGAKALPSGCINAHQAAVALRSLSRA